MRVFAAARAAAALLVVACGSGGASPSPAPPQGPAAPEPGAATTVTPSPAPQPSPDQPSVQPPPPPAPAPSPAPGGTPGTPPRAPTIRWAVSAPGAFWVGMDDSTARWIAADVSARSVLRLEKRGRDGALLWSGEWSYRGPYSFTAAVTPGGEPLFLAREVCRANDPGCHASIDVAGVGRTGSQLVKLGADGAVRWTAAISGELVGADASGGCAVAYVQSSGATSPTPPAVAKLDAQGNTVWSRAITSLAQLRLDRTGAVLAVGCYRDDRELVPGIPCNGLTAARFAPDGSALWTTSQLAGYWPTIDTTADGSGYAAARQFTLSALSPEGVVRWTRPLGDATPRLANQRGEALTIAAAANGPVAVAGYTYPSSPDLSTAAVILGFDAAGSATFADELPFWQPRAMVYGADGELLVATGGGAVDAPAGRVEGAMVVELTP